jgi:hypothetical protein
MVINKKALWSILNKYDGLTDFTKFCDSISNFIQDKSDNTDAVTVFQHFTSIDKEDYTLINESIGSEINSHLFTF